MKKNIMYLITILSFLFVLACDNQDFVSPYDPSYTLPAPTDLVVEQIAVGQCKLTWKDNSQSEEGFKISLKKDDEAWIEDYATVGRNIGEYVDEEILANSNYQYKVMAYAGEYNSSYVENSVSLNFPGPTNFQIIQLSVSSCKLTWQDNSYGEQGYKISRKKDNEEWTEEYAVLGEDSEEFVDNNYSLDSDYTYRVFAYYNTLTSDFVEKSILGKFVLVSGGTFTMGDTRGEGFSNELPIHQVTLSPFRIGKNEVTQAEYQALMGINPSYFSGDDKPVESVTWYDAVEYCNARSIQDGLTQCYDTSDWSCNFSANGYRLPTEAEWEYAARGASNSPDYLYAGSDDVASVAWYSGNSGSITHAVGSKAPNSLGLYDMSGNVWEWCNDWYGNYSSGAQTDPVGPTTGSYRVIRGGSWGLQCYLLPGSFSQRQLPD